MAKAKKKKTKGRRPMTAAEKKAFVARMARYRKDGGKRNPPGPVPTINRTAFANVPTARPPKARKNPARRNPATAAQVKRVLKTASAAVVGGLAAVALVAVARKIAPDAAGPALNVILPIGAGIAATMFRHPESGAAAAGAFGVAAVGLAGVASEAVLAARNPPELVALPSRSRLPIPIGYQIAGG